MADDSAGFNFQDNGEGGAFDWFYGFGKSFVESFPELVGVTPSTDTQKWRQDNPVGGFSSELLGYAVPYTGWFKGVKAISTIEKAAKLMEGGVKNSILSGTVGTAVRQAPFELGRLGVSQVVGDKSFGEMLGQTGLDLALGSGIGGVLHGFASAGSKLPRLETIFPGIDISLPLPLLARKMKEIIDAGAIKDPETLSRANMKLKEVLRDARVEEVSANQKYVGDIPFDDKGDLQSQMNRLFRPRFGEDKKTEVRRFAKGSDFETDAAWKAESQKAGLPEGFEDKGQYFRSISFNPDTPYEMMKGVENRFLGQSTRDVADKAAGTKPRPQMLPVGDNYLLTREADDGMFLLAKKYQGEIGKIDNSDKWLLFKTDQPGFFLKDADKWAKYQTAMSSWTPGAELSTDAGLIYGALAGFAKAFPLMNYRALAAEPGGVASVVGNLLPKGVIGKDNETIQNLGSIIKDYMAPRIFQFRNSARGNWIMNATKATYDYTKSVVDEIMIGVSKVPEGRLVFNRLLSGQPGELGFTPISKLAQAVPDKDFEQVWKLWKDKVSPDKLQDLMVKGEISPEVKALAEEMSKVHKWDHTNLNKLEEALGEDPTKFTGGYGLPRRWEGDIRITLKDDAGEITGIAAGHNRKAALSNAAKLEAEGVGSIDKEFSISQDAEVFGKYLKENNTSLAALHPERGLDTSLRGFKYDFEPFTKKEFVEDFGDTLLHKQRWQAKLSLDDVLTPHLGALAKEDMRVYRRVLARQRDFSGEQSNFGKWQNTVADSVLGPIIGPNSATKIVNATNTAMFDLTLGALKLSYPVVNALQFVQTVAPEIAFVLGKAPAERLAGDYSHFAVGGAKGPTGGMAALSPIKMMYKSIGEMRSPSEETRKLFERAVNDRVIDARIVEDYLGESATKVTNLRGAKDDFVGWLRSLSEFLPQETERFSRTHTFTVGQMIARDYLQRAGKALSPDEIYHFARQFTEKTMFLYSAADKPRVFTTPAGSLMGLFKNWMFHYLGAMGSYTAEGFAHNNWAPLLWQTGGTAALGGLAATPLAGAANEFSKMWGGKGTLAMAHDQFGDKADWIMYGLPSFLGTSLSSGIDTPVLSHPVRDGSSLFSIALWGRMKAVAKAAGSAFDNYENTGEHPGNDKGTRELLMRAFAPTTLYRAMGALEPGKITSLGTGRPLIKDVPDYQRVLYTLGFNPLELAKGQEISEELYEKHTKLAKAEKSLGQAWGQAELEGDGAKMAQIMRQGIVWGVDVSNVIKEGMKELKKQRLDLMTRTMKPKDIAIYRSMLKSGEEE